MEWNQETIAQLRTFWDEGHSTAEIGRRIGVSKNAVVGKAHRLNLPPRPSPIRRDGEGGRRRAPRRVHGPTLPALRAVMTPMPPEPVRPTAPPMLRAVPPASPGVRVSPCCWPIGEPGTRAFHFCDGPALPGKPYCEAHAAVAYVRVRDKRDEVA